MIFLESMMFKKRRKRIKYLLGIVEITQQFFFMFTKNICSVILTDLILPK